MTTTALRPNSTIVNTFTLAGGGSAHAVTSDNSDSSYAEAIYPGYSELRVDFSTYPLTYNEWIRQVRVRVRWATIAPGAITLWYIRMMDQFGNASPTDTYQTTTSGTIYTTEGAWRTTAPDGQPWLQSELDSIQVQIWPGLYTGNVQMPRIYEIYVDIDINENPVATITSPTNGSTFTTSTRPPTVFTYYDPDGDQMEAYRVKVFSDTQYMASGFNPNTDAAVFDTGKVWASAPPLNGVSPNVDFLDGHSYRSYVWLYQVGAPNGTVGNGISVPATSTYTIDIVAPPTPTINATADQTNARVILEITPNDTPDASKTMVVERSDDGGVVWVFVRGGRDMLNIASPPLYLYDYEMPPNTDVIYRARNAVTIGGSTIAGSYSTTTIPVSINTQDYLLKDPLNPNNNIVLNVLGPSVREDKPEDVAFFSPLGRTRKVAVADKIKGVESTLELDFTDEDEFIAFETLRETQRILLLVRGWTNEQWYIRFGQVMSKTLYNYTPTYRTVTIPWVEVDSSAAGVPIAAIDPDALAAEDDDFILLET
jgi:hypothetical protein